MKRIRPVITVILLSLLSLACVSRYRLDLYLTTSGIDKKVKLERSEYVTGAAIRDPFGDEKVTAGTGNCMILNLTARGQRLKMDKAYLLGYDEYFHCLLYLQLPMSFGRDTVELAGNSFVQVTGRYDIPRDEKVYLPQSGTLVVDSLVKKQLFGTIHGSYQNNREETLGVNGSFKAKVAR